MVTAGEAPEEEAIIRTDGAVSGGAERGGADRGTGGENIPPLLSRLDLLAAPPPPPPPLIGPLGPPPSLAEGDDWLLVHHFHSGCFLKWSSFC